MAMASNNEFNYQTRMFFILAIFTWVLTFAFFIIQYTREREYKYESMHLRLQSYNEQLITDMNNGIHISDAVVKGLDPSDSLRVTVIDFSGKVLFDTDSGRTFENHSMRQEFRDAMAHGNGYTVRRQSAEINREFFYSATRGKNVVIRSALPYGNNLVQALRINSVYVWIVIAIAVAMTVFAFYAAKRIGRSIRNLRDFADKAESGDIDDSDTFAFPHDELGEISSHIVNIYKNLKRTTIQRDRNLNEALYEEKEKIRIKRQLTNNINHELKTPVHAIQACLETIENNGDKLSKEEMKSLIDRAYDNVRRLCSLLQDVATITRINDAPAQILTSTVDIGAIIEEIKDDMSTYPPEKRLEMIVDVPESLTIDGNQGLIESIFRNLVINSLSYSCGSEIHIKLIADTADEYQFEFYDNGVGVSDEHLPHLFERFYRIDAGRSRKMGGTGLGLSIVKNAVLFHNGSIKVENRKEGGLLFTFSLAKHVKQ
jgi:two-component system OmpR family sensor kinase